MRKRSAGNWQEASERGAQWTAEDARKALLACAQSGKSTVEFARQHGLSVQRLYWWRNRLKESEEQGTQALARLIPVTVRAGRGNAEAVTITDGELRVEIADTNAVPAAWVAALLCLARGGGR